MDETRRAADGRAALGAAGRVHAPGQVVVAHPAERPADGRQFTGVLAETGRFGDGVGLVADHDPQFGRAHHLQVQRRLGIAQQGRKDPLGDRVPSGIRGQAEGLPVMPGPEQIGQVILDFFQYYTALTADRRANPTDDLATLAAHQRGTSLGFEPALFDASTPFWLVVVAGVPFLLLSTIGPVLLGVVGVASAAVGTGSSAGTASASGAAASRAVSGSVPASGDDSTRDSRTGSGSDDEGAGGTKLPPSSTPVAVGPGSPVVRAVSGVCFSDRGTSTASPASG